MPVTPFHFGPGAALKGVLGSTMSLSVFGLANMVIDVEPILLFILTQDPAHPYLHTLPGATLVMMVCIWPGRRICEVLLSGWNARLSPGQARWLAVRADISRSAAVLGAALGAYSHIFLDSIMHFDVRPLAPVVLENPWLGLVSLDSLHDGCLVLGGVGLGGLVVRRVVQARTTSPS